TRICSREELRLYFLFTSSVKTSSNLHWLQRPSGSAAGLMPHFLHFVWGALLLTVPFSTGAFSKRLSLDTGIPSF
ncbi:MAG: hypothetical protein OEX09_09210, partial [Candidatus Bathyarchaeota archaeon]|nr:hypothetical protein [Candidatus Bathyarchaeota archaeon]